MSRIVLAAVAALVAVMAAELVTRSIDGYRVFAVHLTRERESQPAARPDLRHVPVPLADGVNADWYEDTPETPRGVTTPDVAARASRHPDDPYSPFFWWNATFIRDQLCGHKDGAPGSLDDFYVFDPED